MWPPSLRPLSGPERGSRDWPSPSGNAVPCRLPSLIHRPRPAGLREGAVHPPGLSGKGEMRGRKRGRRERQMTWNLSCVYFGAFCTSLKCVTTASRFPRAASRACPFGGVVVWFRQAFWCLVGLFCFILGHSFFYFVFFVCPAAMIAKSVDDDREMDTFVSLEVAWKQLCAVICSTCFKWFPVWILAWYFEVLCISLIIKTFCRWSSTTLNLYDLLGDSLILETLADIFGLKWEKSRISFTPLKYQC